MTKSLPAGRIPVELAPHRHLQCCRLTDFPAYSECYRVKLQWNRLSSVKKYWALSPEPLTRVSAAWPRWGSSSRPPPSPFTENFCIRPCPPVLLSYVLSCLIDRSQRSDMHKHLVITAIQFRHAVVRTSGTNNTSNIVNFIVSNETTLESVSKSWH